MSTPAMHLQAEGASQAVVERPCDTCGTLFAPKKPWQRFCKTYANRCHTAFHTAEARLAAVKEASPELYRALTTIIISAPACPAQTDGCACPACVARCAIADLKPPETPKALLEKALA